MVGLDLAKDVIAACVLDVHGVVIERRVLRRAAFERWAEQLPSCKVAMEACGSAHHWGRWFASRGHTARLIAAEFVVPFRKGGKNDTAPLEMRSGPGSACSPLCWLQVSHACVRYHTDHICHK